MHLKPELVPAFGADRLLILSPFAPGKRQHQGITTTLAEERNRFVGTLASRIFVPHAAPNSRTLALCQSLLAAGKHLGTIHDPANQHLADLGAEYIF